MKVLKRPMFKYGGDVKKQGIMHGMNGLRNGGVATTMADATGMANGGIMRQGYQDGLLVAPGINMSNVRSSPIENFYKNNTANVRGNYSDLNKPQKVLTRDERIEQQKKVFEPSYTFQDLYEKNMNVTDEKIPQQTRYGVVMVDNPNYGRVKRVDQVKPTDTMLMKQKEISEGIYPGGEKISEQEEFLETEGGDRSDIKKPKVSKKDTDAARLKRIYDIMGVDDAKKDAVYDALIDVSQGQGIDTKDISGSINRVVGALSKRTDKVTDLKDKGKAALASGTIQEMFRDDRSNYAKVAQELVTSGVYKTYPEALKAVTKIDNDTLGKRILTNAKTQAGVKVNDKSILNTLAAEKDYKEEIFSKEMFNKKIKENEFTDAIDVVTKVKDLKVNDTSKDGLYKVGLTVIRVTNGYPAIVFNR
jgi:hypothetical protein